MNKPDASPLEKTVLYLKGNSLAVQKTGPANRDERKELKQLDKEGLAKVLVIDTSASFITNKTVLQKLIDELSNGDNVFSEIADRSQRATIWYRFMPPTYGYGNLGLRLNGISN